MALRTDDFVLRSGERAELDAKKRQLLDRHHEAVERVLAEAKTFSDDRQRALEKISNNALRKSASR